MQSDLDPEVLRGQLDQLAIEHRNLDATIATLSNAPPHDELQLRRLKKRKLQLKDRIILLERLLPPDEPA